MIKIDMAKTYDRVNRKFLLEVMRRLGFLAKWRDLIFNYIAYPMCSIMINGMVKGFFKPSRGLRQGDPLSLYIFILSEEILSHMIRVEFNKGIKPFSHLGVGGKGGRGGAMISHLFYTDDLLVFANGGKCSVR